MFDKWISELFCKVAAGSLWCLTSLGRSDSPFHWPGCELCFTKEMVGQALLFMRSINKTPKNHNALTWFLHFFQRRLAGYIQFMGSPRVGQDWATKHSIPARYHSPLLIFLLPFGVQCLRVSDEQPRLILAAQTHPGPWIHSFFRPRPRPLPYISTLGSPLVGALHFPILHPSGQTPHGTGDHGVLLQLA